jgi:hypothetical protein
MKSVNDPKNSDATVAVESINWQHWAFSAFDSLSHLAGSCSISELYQWDDLLLQCLL